MGQFSGNIVLANAAAGNTFTSAATATTDIYVQSVTYSWALTAAPTAFVSLALGWTAASGTAPLAAGTVQNVVFISADGRINVQLATPFKIPAGTFATFRVGNSGVGALAGELAVSYDGYQ